MHMWVRPASLADGMTHSDLSHAGRGRLADSRQTPQTLWDTALPQSAAVTARPLITIENEARVMERFVLSCDF